MFHGLDSVGRLRRFLIDTSRRLVVVLEAGTALIGRIDARNGDKLVSYSAAYAESIVNLNTPAAGGNLICAAVPGGTIRHVTVAVAYNENTNPASITLYANYSGIVSMPLNRVLLPGVLGHVFFNGHIILRPGDNIFAAFGAGALNDNTYLRVCGWDESL